MTDWVPKAVFSLLSPGCTSPLHGAQAVSKQALEAPGEHSRLLCIWIVVSQDPDPDRWG